MRRRVRPLVMSVSTVVALSLAVQGMASARKYALGDSVMQGATRELRARRFTVDTATNRQFADGPQIVRRLARRDRLPRKVGIHLGNNGYIDPADCRRAVNNAGDRQVFPVTVKVPGGWRRTNNERLRTCARRHGADVIDWYSFSRSHDSWFYDDGFHLTPVGQRKYARLSAARREIDRAGYRGLATEGVRSSLRVRVDQRATELDEALEGCKGMTFF